MVTRIFQKERLTYGIELSRIDFLFYRKSPINFTWKHPINRFAVKRGHNVLNLEDIIEIRKATERSGYEIVFPDNKIIWLIKRRTIIGLLLLLKYEYCSEADLVRANDRLQSIKEIL